MRKKILFLLIAFAFIFIGTYSVNAATTLTQADFDAAVANLGVETNKITCEATKCKLASDEEYIISGEINTSKVINISNGTTITLDNATINDRVLFKTTQSSTNTVKGTGTFTKPVSSMDGGMVIDGNLVFNDTLLINPVLHDDPSTIKSGTFNSLVQIYYPVFTINGGTFNRGLEIHHANGNISGGTFKIENDPDAVELITVKTASILAISGGTFEIGENATAAAIIIKSDSEVSISGGTFKSSGVAVMTNLDESVTLDISGGTFIGGEEGAYFGADATTTLTGGTFKTLATSTPNGAIAADGNFQDLLGAGYKFSAEIPSITTFYGINFADISEISVIHEPYDFLAGLNQTYNSETDETLSFRIDSDYSNFTNGGKVFIDGTETTEFTSASGSTIITLNNSLLRSLSAGSYTLKVVFNNGGVATTTFTVGQSATNLSSSNPTTADHIVSYVSILGLSLIGLVGVGIYLKKRKFN